MPAPFRAHPSDTEILNRNIKPLSQCNKRLVPRGENWIEITDVEILTAECLWHIYQDEAEQIVAPAGVLIADPIARNRAINAAYARLWLADPRFQWAGLAAFASKQVGCGLLHATQQIDLIGKQQDTLDDLNAMLRTYGGRVNPQALSETDRKALIEAADRYRTAKRESPIPGPVFRSDKDDLSLFQEQFDFVNKMMALGNTALFLDIYPLHAFYAKRGIKELTECLRVRNKIYGHKDFPVMWPVKQETLRFGQFRDEIIQAFEAIEAGDIAQSVVHLAWHEQKNILQPAMYSDWWLRILLRGNHVSFITDLFSGAAQALELTLASQCRPLEDGRTIGFSDSAVANLANIDERMEFVLRAAGQFDAMLNDHRRAQIQQSIIEIAGGASSL